MNPKKNNIKKVAKNKPKSALKQEKRISSKNYLYAFLILVGGIILTLYIFEWMNVKKEEKLMTSYLISSNTIDSSIEDLDSFNQVRQESPNSYFIYLSYTGDEEVYNFEKILKRNIDNYNLRDNLYYIDLTKLMKDNENYIEIVKTKLGIKEIEKVPAIIYVHNGEIIESNILDGINGTMLKVADLENLLDIYDYELVK